MHPTAVSAFTAGAGLLCLVVAALIWFVGDRHTPRVVAFLVLAGSTLLLNNPIGRWLHSTTAWANDEIGRWVGDWFGVAILAIAGIVAAYMFAVHVWKRRVDEHTLLSAAALPLTVSAIPGPIGDVLSKIVFGLGNVVGTLIAGLFGLH